MKTAIIIFSFITSSLFGFNASMHEQMLIVIVDDWGYSTGKMWCFEKSAAQATWSPLPDSFKVQLGKKGLAWGRGLHTHKTLVGPKKNESDDCSPAGIFAIGPFFGFSPKNDISYLKGPYIHITASLEAVDDVHSAFYNQIVDTQYVTPDWTSSIKMQTCSSLKWGAIIEYNCHPSIPKDGSCIFLCVNTKEALTRGLGCTCLDEPDLLKILNWLCQSKNPVIVQLTKQDYLQYKDQWKLPDMEWIK